MNQRLVLSAILIGASALACGCRDKAADPAADASSKSDHAAARDKLVGEGQALTDATGAAALVFTEYDHDFGRILDTEKVSTVFKFVNQGKETIRLGKPQASCGCTVPTLEKSEYAAGESGSIDVTFSPKGSGKVTKNITIPIDGGGEPVRLSISANVVPILAVEPRGVSFINVKRGQEVSTPVVIKSRDPKVKIISAEAKNCPVKIVIDNPGSETDNADLPGMASLSVILPADTPVGIVAGIIQLKILASAAPGDEQREQSVQLNVSGSVKGDLFTQPARFTIPSVAPGADFESAILVRSQSDANFKLKSVELKDANFEGVTADFDVYEFAGISAYRITLHGAMPETIGKMLSGRLVITTDVPGEEELNVMVSGRVPPKGGPVPSGGPRPSPTPQPPSEEAPS